MKRRDKGSGSLYLRGKVWWIKYHDPNGRPRQESTLTTSKTKAQEKLKIALGKCASGTLEEPYVKRIKIDELADDFFRDYRHQWQAEPGCYRSTLVAASQAVLRWNEGHQCNQ